MTYIPPSHLQPFHDPWLKAAGNRCMMFPFLRVGQVNGKYHAYAIHHAHTTAYLKDTAYLAGEGAPPKFFWDMLVLSKFAHDWVFHWLLSWGKRRVRLQQNFPNLAQHLANQWCRTMWLLCKILGYLSYLFDEIVREFSK